jgi:hypothetical protein
VQFVEHHGTKILFLDFGGISRPDEALGTISHAEDLIAMQAEGSVRTLTYVAGAHFNLDVAKAMLRLARHDKPYVEAAALVGAAGMQEVLKFFVEKMSGRTFRSFDEIEEAKDWLVEQSGSTEP